MQALRAGQQASMLMSQVSLDGMGRPSTSSLINDKVMNVAPRTKVGGGSSSIISNAMLDRYKNLRRQQSGPK